MKKRIAMLTLAILLCGGVNVKAAENVEVTVPEDAEIADAEVITGEEETVIAADLTYDIFKFTMDKSGNITITGLVDPSFSADIHLEIPAEINGNPVTAIGSSAFENNKNIKSVVFNEGLKVIDVKAFKNCTNLEGDIVLPASLTTLQGAYYTSDKNGAFMNTSIKSVTVKDGTDALKIGYRSFEGCKMLETVQLSGRENTIGAYAFNGCPNLKTLFMPAGVVKKTIEMNAFNGCAITSLDIPGTVTSIGEWAFSECLALTTLTLHEGLETIGKGAFYNCNSLAGKLTLPASLTKIDGQYYSSDKGGAFEYTALTEVELLDANSSLTIGNRTFHACESLTKVTLSGKVASIGTYAFSDTPNLKTVTLTSGNYKQEIGSSAFRNSGLVEIVIPEKVSTIGDNAFDNCQSLTKLTLNKGLVTIGEAAFNNCVRLTGELVIPSTVTKINSKAFYNTAITSLSVNDANEALSIGANAFAGCKLLETADLSNRLSSLGDNSFDGDDYLVWVRIKTGKYELTIGKNVFQNNKDLVAIVLPKRLKSIGSNNFEQSSKLKNVYYDGSADEHGQIKISRDKNTYYFLAEMNYNSAGPDPMPVPHSRTLFKSYDGYNFYFDDDDGDITCDTSDGKRVIDQFKSDGDWTYYFQADGTAMRDRLTYHPDGIHVIYFDENAHEVFSNFKNVKKTIAGKDVDDYCFFDINGYLYVDVVTYDQTGTYLYYANPYGVLEKGWFQFSDNVMYPDPKKGPIPWEGAAGGYGYAQEDFTLLTNTWTYDWLNRLCYMQGNGVALYQ